MIFENSMTKKLNIDRAMLVICFFYAIFFNLIPFLGRIAEVLLVLSLFFIAKNQQFSLVKDKCFQILIASFFVIIISWLAVKSTHPDMASDLPDLRFFLRLFIFIPIAYWLKGNNRNIHYFLMISALTIIISTFTRGEGIDEWIYGLLGNRVDFNIINAQHTTLLMAVALLGITIYAIPKTISQWKNLRLSQKIFSSTLCFFAFTVFLLGTLISQTRGVWLALLVSAFSLGVVYIYNLNRISFKKILIFSTFIGILFSTLTYFSLLDSIIAKRISSESGVVTIALKEGIESVPYTSIGIRLHSWHEALDWIKMRPILGAGELAKKEVIQRSDLPQSIKDDFRHLHNYYLEILVAYGFIGLLILALLYYRIFYVTLLMWRKTRISSPLAYFTLSVLITTIVANNFESYNSMWSGWIIHNIVFSVAYSYYIYRDKNDDSLHHI